ncbi:MAG TPA: hypothetical protein VIF40_09075 [Methylosinus sp.]|uniref:hypothetical protein n=1 Tax=Methylosinus sp. TaxID=427 RepID=UPI002F92F3BE
MIKATKSRSDFNRSNRSAQAEVLSRTTHPIDDNARSFYARWGFCELPYDPRRAMIIRMADLRLSFAERQ